MRGGCVFGPAWVHVGEMGEGQAERGNFYERVYNVVFVTNFY